MKPKPLLSLNHFTLPIVRMCRTPLSLADVRGSPASRRSLPNAHLFRGLEAPASGCRPLPAKSGNRETAESKVSNQQSGDPRVVPRSPLDVFAGVTHAQAGVSKR